MQIITISGLDGSGKSTQIKLLKEHLESRGAKVFYFHAISFSLPNKILSSIKKLCYSILRSRDSVTSKKNTEEEKDSQNSVAKSSWFGILLRKIILPIDLWRFSLLRSKLRNKGYDYILSDRYFYDTVVNIEYLSQKNLKYIPSIKKPAVSIYLQADPEAIMTRSKKVPDQGLQFLKDKKKILDKKTELWNWQIVNNTHKNKLETSEEIKQVVSKINLVKHEK